MKFLLIMIILCGALFADEILPVDYPDSLYDLGLDSMSFSLADSLASAGRFSIYDSYIGISIENYSFYIGGNEVFEITKDGANVSESEKIKTLEARIEALENKVGIIMRFINWIKSL